MSGGQCQSEQDLRGGFTLVEVLAGFAITTAVIVGAATLVRDMSYHFDRGTRRVTEVDRLVMALDRLSADFAAARFVMRDTDAGTAVAFAAERASDETPAKTTFVTNAVGAAPRGSEVVFLTIHRDSQGSRLVRQRTPWTGVQRRFDELTPQDPVVLIHGKWNLEFLFGWFAAEGALTWYRDWPSAQTLPRFVRLIARDPDSGVDILGEADFAIRSNAPPACGRPEAAIGCFLSAPVRSQAQMSGKSPR
jgi:hypothetical protein